MLFAAVAVVDAGTEVADVVDDVDVVVLELTSFSSS